MKNKKGIAVCLVLVLLLSFVAGCGKDTKNSSQKEGTENIGQEDDTSVSGDGKNGGMVTIGGSAYGRYIEEEIFLPEQSAGIGGNHIQLNPQGEVELYSVENDWKISQNKGITHFVLQPDDTWQLQQDAWIESWDSSILLEGVSYAPDGTLYVVGLKKVSEGEEWEDYQNLFFSVAPGEETAEPLKLEQDVLEDFGFWVSELLDNGTGRMMVLPSSFPTDITVLDSTTGKKLFGFLPNTSMPIWYGEDILMAEEQGAKLAVLDGTTGERKKEIAILDVADSTSYRETVLYAEAGNGIWLACPEGLLYQTEGGSKWEVLLEASASVMGMPACSLGTLMKASDDVFYLSYSNSDYQNGLVRIRYSEDVVAMPETTLVIYSLDKCESILQAVVEFQREHPEVKVEYRAVMSENSSATREDCIQALNTELLAGQGADLLVMDGLPFHSYVEKGVLEDISNLAEELAMEGSIFPNIIEAMRMDSGIFQIPTYINIPIWIGSERARTATGSIKELVEASAQAELPFFGKTNYQYVSLFEMLYEIYGGHILEATDLTDVSRASDLEERLTSFLLAYQELVMQSGIEDETYLEESLVSSVLGGNGELGYYCVHYESQLMMFSALVRESGDNYHLAGNSFDAVASMAVNKTSENKEVAYEFIRKLLSESLQDTALDGIPVNPKSIEKKKTKQNLNVMSGIRYEKRRSDGTTEEAQLLCPWPSVEEQTEFYGHLTELKHLRESDSVIRELIAAQIPALWKKERSVEEISADLYQKIKTYLSE